MKLLLASTAICFLGAALPLNTYAQSAALDALIRESVTAAMAGKEHLNLTPPDGYKLGSEQQVGVADVSTYVPESESAEVWTTALMVAAVPHPMNIPAQQANNMVVGNLSRFCSNPESKSLSEVPENGYEVSSWYMGCSMNSRANKPEYMYSKIIKGQYSTYTLTFEIDNVPTAAQSKFVTDYLAKIKLCNVDGGDHPC